MYLSNLHFFIRIFSNNLFFLIVFQLFKLTINNKYNIKIEKIENRLINLMEFFYLYLKLLNQLLKIKNMLRNLEIK